MPFRDNYRSKSVDSIILSVVIPVFKCENCLHELCQRIRGTLQDLSIDAYEIIMVNDYSPGNDWLIIKSLVNQDSRIKGIKLSKNFGQYNAITAGLDHSSGDWVVIMDCDLQDQPEEIAKLWCKAQEGYDIVIGKREDRQDGLLKRLSSKYFYKLFGYLTDSSFDESISQFGIYNRKVIDSIKNMRENLRFFPTMVRWVGFNSTTTNVCHSSRMDGKSSYSYKKLINLALEVIVSYSDKPLRLTVKIGLTTAFFSFLYALYIFYIALMGIRSIEGWPSIIVSIWFFSGVSIFIMGIIGIYICRIYDEVKQRPIYIIDEVFQKDIT